MSGEFEISSQKQKDLNRMLTDRKHLSSLADEGAANTLIRDGNRLSKVETLRDTKNFGGSRQLKKTNIEGRQSLREENNVFSHDADEFD